MWCTFIIYLKTVQEVSHHVAHAKYSLFSTGTSGDASTEREAIRIFKQSDSRSFLMVGARAAVPITSAAPRPLVPP